VRIANEKKRLSAVRRSTASVITSCASTRTATSPPRGRGLRVRLVPRFGDAVGFQAGIAHPFRPGTSSGGAARSDRGPSRRWTSRSPPSVT
jgi:hypothetical protein